MYTQKTFSLKKEEADKKWFVVDATDKVVGRLASEIAKILRGKNKPTFTPNQDAGDFVVLINAEKVKFTGKKWDDKIYYRHTNHIGGLRKRTAKEQLSRRPDLIMTSAVQGMLPKTSLGRKQLTKFKVVIGAEHGYEAQKPETLELKA
jgi:large subunit ribosomal protein L13